MMNAWKKKDVKLFLILIPIFTALNYLISYAHIVYDTAFLIAFLADLVQGYVCWLVIRYIIIRMEKKHSLLHFSWPKLLKQFLFTFLAGVFVVLLPDGSFEFTGERYAIPDNAYAHDLVIFFIWIMIVNCIYVGMFYYDIWKRSEASLTHEKTIKSEGFHVKIGDKNLKIKIRDIHGFYFENGCTFIIGEGHRTHIVDSSLNQLEQKLPAQFFFRVNRQFILHRNSITSFKRIEDNKLLIFTPQQEPFPGELVMSRLKAPAFKKWFEEDSVLV